MRSASASIRAGRRDPSAAVALPIAAFFALFLLFPIWHVFEGAFRVDGEGRFTLDGFVLAFKNEVFVAALRDSALMALAVTALSSAIAAPLAHLFHTYRLAAKGALQACLLAALVLPPIVGAIGFRQVFARFGSVNLVLMDLGLVSEPIDFLGANPLLGVIVVATLHLYPILFLNLQAALGSVDPALFEAAEAAGASRARRFFRIGLPLLLPGWFAGAVIVFIFALTDLGAPIVFGARDLVSIQIFERASEGSRDPIGYALVVVVLVLTTLLFLAARLALRRVAPLAATKGITSARPRELPRRAKPLVYAALLALALFTLLPHLSVLLLSLSKSWFFTALPTEWTLEHFARVAHDELAYLGVRNSLVYALCSTAIDVALGAAIAWLVVRRGGAAAAAIDVLAMLPLALPGIVLAFGYAYAFAKTPLDPRVAPFWLLVIGYAVRRLPYVVRSADAGFRQLPPALEEAARGLGASAGTTWRRVTLPLLAGHLLAGAILAFSFALLEVSESLILAPTKESYPIAKSIYILAGDLGSGAQLASALGVVGSVLLLYALFVASRLLGRGIGELFRA